ncbi:hypothetical protein ILYODFUR_038839, partial [Ilyodon furcidens]
APSSPVGSDKNVSCPLCDNEFTQEFIQIHASMCGEKERHSTILGADDTSKHLSSLSDILRFLQEIIDNTKTFNMNVTRQDLHQRGLKQWARQKQASPKNQLRISFIGEQGTDDGALRREFLT